VTISDNDVEAFTSSTATSVTFNEGLLSETVLRVTNGSTTPGGNTNSDMATKYFVDANVSITADAVNQVNSPHTFDVTATAFVPTGYTGTVSLNNLTPCDSTPVKAGLTWSCTYEVASSTPAAIVQDATASFDFGFAGATETIVRTTSGNSGPGGTGPATKYFVDANISIAADAVNKVNTAHVFTITANALVPAGYGGTITLNSLTPCNDTPVKSGNTWTCTKQVNSSTPTTIVQNASVSFDFGFAGTTATVDRATDGNAGPGGSGPATKYYVDANISIESDAVNQVGTAHIFTITANALVPASYGGTVTLTSLSPCDGIPVQSSNTWTCTYQVNSSTPTTIIQDASVSFHFGFAGITATVNRSTSGNAGPGGSGPATKYYVDANISIEADDVNEVNTPHIFTITANALVPASYGGTVTLNSLSPCDGTPVQSSNTWTCTYQVNSSTSTTIVQHADVSFDFDFAGTTATVDRTTNGNSGPGGSGPATKVYVDARISIAPDGTNGIGENHTFTVTAQKNEGAGGGWVAADDNTIVTVTLANSGGSSYSISSDTCASPGTTGSTCTVTFTSATAGTVTGHAAANILSGGLSLFRETNGLAGNSGDATKIFVDGSLTWLKHNSQGALLGGATFQVCRTHDRFGTDIADECVSVLDNSPPDADGDAGEFKLENLYLGRYTIAETVPPAGYEGDPFVETIELTLAAPDKSATHIWVNVPGQGCTPGWWKNQGVTAYDQASDPLAQAVSSAVLAKWGIVTDGTTTSLFRDAFNLTPAQMQGLPADLTLLQAIELGGGGFNALARHGAGALLNSLSVAYEFTDDQVLQDVHDAFISGVIGTLIDDYATASERDHSFCPTG
jgi:hypothetical protein